MVLKCIPKTVSHEIPSTREMPAAGAEAPKSPIVVRIVILFSGFDSQWRWIIHRTLLGDSLRSSPPLRRPPRGDRSIAALEPFNPEHDIAVTCCLVIGFPFGHLRSDHRNRGIGPVRDIESVSRTEPVPHALYARPSNVATSRSPDFTSTRMREVRSVSAISRATASSFPLAGER